MLCWHEKWINCIFSLSVSLMKWQWTKRSGVWSQSTVTVNMPQIIHILLSPSLRMGGSLPVLPPAIYLRRLVRDNCGRGAEHFLRHRLYLSRGDDANWETQDMFPRAALSWVPPYCLFHSLHLASSHIPVHTGYRVLAELFNIMNIIV